MSALSDFVGISMIKVLGFVCALSLMPTAAFGAAVLDQSNMQSISGGYQAGFAATGYTLLQNLSYHGQTVTAGKAGRLTMVEIVTMGNPSSLPSLEFSLFDGGSNSALGSALIGSVAIPASDVLGVNSILAIDVSGFNFDVLPGDTFSLVFRATSPGSAAWMYRYGFPVSLASPYAGGTSFRSFNGGASFIPSAEDFFFSTYVDEEEVEVPEPAALSLLGLGALGIAVRRRTAKSI